MLRVDSHWRWMALQRRVNLAQIKQIALFKKPCFHPHGVQGGRSVTLRRRGKEVENKNN